MNYLRIASGVAFIAVCACSGPGGSNSSPTNQVGTRASSGGKDPSGNSTSGGNPAGTVFVWRRLLDDSAGRRHGRPATTHHRPARPARATMLGTSATAGCGSPLLPVPSDPGVRGPWKVGVQTVTIGRLTVEITYPAQPGSESGMPEVTYNASAFLPGTEATKIKTADVSRPGGRRSVSRLAHRRGARSLPGHHQHPRHGVVPGREHQHVDPVGEPRVRRRVRRLPRPRSARHARFDHRLQPSDVGFPGRADRRHDADHRADIAHRPPRVPRRSHRRQPPGHHRT